MRVRVRVRVCVRRGDSGSGTVPVASLSGIYPNARAEGIGRGHWFALLEMAARFKELK